MGDKMGLVAVDGRARKAPGARRKRADRCTYLRRRSRSDGINRRPRRLAWAMVVSAVDRYRTVDHTGVDGGEDGGSGEERRRRRRQGRQMDLVSIWNLYISFTVNFPVPALQSCVKEVRPSRAASFLPPPCVLLCSASRAASSLTRRKSIPDQQIPPAIRAN